MGLLYLDDMISIPFLFFFLFFHKKILHSDVSLFEVRPVALIYAMAGRAHGVLRTLVSSIAI